MSSWNAGAVTTSMMLGAGRYTFGVPVGVAGAVVGLNSSAGSTRPEEIQHAFYVSSGRFRIIESGAAKTDWAAYTGTGPFHILRHAGVVYYCVGGTPEPHAAVPGGLPGALIYVSTVPSVGAVLLDASLHGVGDTVQSVALHELAGASARLSFPPMGVSAASGAYAGAALTFRPMRISAAGAPRPSTCRVALSPMTILASQGEYTYAAVRMRPPVVVSGPSDIEQTIDGVAMSMPYMRVAASGYRWIAPTVNVAFPPMGMKAYAGAHAEAGLSFRPMVVRAADTPATTVPYFSIVLPAITGDATEYIVEDLSASDEVAEDTIHKLSDAVAASDGLQIDETELYQELALASDAVRHSSADLVADDAVADDALVFDDADFVADVATASDAVETESALDVELSDTATASEAIEHESLDFVDAAADAAEVVEMDAADFVADVAVADEAVEVVGESFDLVLDVAAADEAVEITGTSITLVEDVAEASDAVFQKDPRAVAWVLNTESGAPYWYSNWQISDMAQAGDKVFAVGPEGLLLVGADADDGADIDASIGYGFMDLGSGQKTRVDAFWFSYTSTDVLEVSVETYGQGYPPYPYEMQPVPADQPRNNRIKPGKGLNARYWRLTLNNVGGCDFSVDETSADLAVSSRRI